MTSPQAYYRRRSSEVRYTTEPENAMKLSHEQIVKCGIALSTGLPSGPRPQRDSTGLTRKSKAIILSSVLSNFLNANRSVHAHVQPYANKRSQSRPCSIALADWLADQKLTPRIKTKLSVYFYSLASASAKKGKTEV